jgi:Iron-sulfur cluster assembly protein
VTEHDVDGQSGDDQPVGVGVGVRKGFALPRDCEVTIVPAGHRTILAKGDRVTLLQALGGTATVKTREGEMARLSRADSIEFGFIEAPDTETRSVESDVPFSVERVWEAATTVYDPEIPVDIVELGLVYRVEAEPLASGGWRVEIDMSVTAPFCGMGDILRRICTTRSPRSTASRRSRSSWCSTRHGMRRACPMSPASNSA